jgi:hypothetical protein
LTAKARATLRRVMFQNHGGSKLHSSPLVTPRRAAAMYLFGISLTPN